jgi:GMP synthase-like glutamine amidotransferase
MKIHCFQHVPFETPAHILTWAAGKKHTVTETLLYNHEKPPASSGFDLLVVMGGPMSVHDTDQYPWLAPEKEAVAQAIACGKFVLGICLGAQVIADVLGGRVTKNMHKEIGWMPLAQTEEIMRTSPFAALPGKYTAFHWHGETFSIPPGAVLQSSSEGCAHQGFMYKSTVIALQYHIEATAASAGALIDHCGDELVEGRYIHKKEKILGDTARYQTTANGLLERLLDTWLY